MVTEIILAPGVEGGHKMAAKRETSVEPRVEEKAIGWLRKYSIQYWLKTESMNSEIDNALKEALSKLGGSGGNVPDLKCFIDYHGRKIPVMIEAKGYKSFLEKLNDMGEVDNYTKKGLPNHQNINKYAVNGAIHYATAIINGTESYKEVIAIGITGWGDPKKIETALKVYYVSDENYNVPKQVGEYEDLSFLSDSELPDFIEKIDSLYLTEEEREMLTQKLETQIETNLKKLNQEMRDTYSISETYRVKLISGMIIAGLGVIENGKTIVSPLEIDELRSKEDKRSHDGVIIMNTISSYLESKDIPSEKVELIKTNFEQVFIQTDLYKQYQPGEIRLKKVYITVKKDIIPFFAKKKYHLDFTGKLFNVLNDWVKIPDGDQNDVVLTPRYVCDLMAKLCQVNKDSYVWDYATGSGGFLVASMKAMIKDANQIENKEEREAKINSIKMKQLLGIELRPDMYSLAVLNMFLMGDGSTHILCDDSLRNYSGKYEQGVDKDEDFPADVFLLNPPYSEKGKGFNFVKLALSRMKGGRAAVLIQENAGGGEGGSFSRDILENNTLVASIKMGNIFCGRSNVQTAIYSFKLTDADRYILSLNKEYKEYKITDIFNIVNTHSILQSQINENSGGTPYLTAAEGNNSVSTYISCDDKWIDEGNCIFIGGKTMTITYQEKDFFSNDSHNLALYLKDNSKRNKYIQCFFITALKKSLGTKYYWGDSISKKKIQNDTVFLPINDKMEIDYDYMKSYIKVIEKIVISDVVKYKDSLNTASDITSD